MRRYINIVHWLETDTEHGVGVQNRRPKTHSSLHCGTERPVVRMVVVWRVCHHEVRPQFNDGLLDNGRQFGVRREATVREAEKAWLNRKQGSRLFGRSPARSSELVRVSQDATSTCH